MEACVEEAIAQENTCRRRKLRVTVSGGGPVGLAFALTIKDLMRDEVEIEIYDPRWTQSNGKYIWRGTNEGNARRQQVVTLQSRQYAALPKNVQDVLFENGSHSEMWPVGPDSPNGRPRNIKISDIEDAFLRLVDAGDFNLHTTRFDPEINDVNDRHVLVIAEGSQSNTRDFFQKQFGRSDDVIYSIDENHLEDVVLGLKVKSNLSDSASVIVTIAQNRFLLNSLNGEGFLNMRLSPSEVREVIGFNLQTGEFAECIQSNPCMMIKEGNNTKEKNNFFCATHGSYFKPAIDAKNHASVLWPRILEGLKLYQVKLEDLTGITAFRLSMVQRPRFTAELSPATRHYPATYGCLLGDAANAIHFWPGRGLNSGLASAISLARALKRWDGRRLRDADFMRHEAFMSMLQYRHKSRAWRAMINTDIEGRSQSVSQSIREAYVAASSNPNDQTNFAAAFFERLQTARTRLVDRIGPLPSDEQLRAIASSVSNLTCRVLVQSGAWDSERMGGEEADVDWLLAPNMAEAQTSYPTPKQSPSPNLDEPTNVLSSSSEPLKYRLRWFLIGTFFSFLLFGVCVISPLSEQLKVLVTKVIQVLNLVTKSF